MEHLKTLSRNFWKFILPIHILGLIGLFYVGQYWVSLLVFWFVVGVIGNGVAAHRYFSHSQFETYTPIRYILAYLTILGGIGSPTDWSIQHTIHHAKTDKENDPHSPKYSSAFHVFYGWIITLKNSSYIAERYSRRIAITQLRNNFYGFFHYNRIKIIYGTCLILFLINPIYPLLYALAVCLDFVRIGCVNYFCHTSGYRNHECRDNSRNNLLVGWLGMGFGWHNNHHAHVGRLILHERWWEIDIEGYVGWILSKNKFNDNKNNI